MTKIKAMVLAAGLLIPLSAWGADKVKIGYVDLQKVFLTSDVGRQSKKSLDKEAESHRMKLDEMKKNFQKMQDDLEKKKDVLSDESKRQKFEELMKTREDIVQYVQKSDADLAEKDRDLTRRITADLQGILKNLSAKEGYTIILEKGSILWAPDDMDITDQVIGLYNKQSRK